MDKVWQSILQPDATIAVVGLSNRPERPSYQVAKFLVASGFQVIPIHPGYHEVLGAKAYSSLQAVGQPIDVVNIFRRSEEVLPIVAEAISLQVAGIWLQEQIISLQAATLAAEKGIPFVMDRCLKKAYAEWKG